MYALDAPWRVNVSTIEITPTEQYIGGIYIKPRPAVASGELAYNTHKCLFVTPNACTGCAALDTHTQLVRFFYG
ncbi:MAG: hypothetical protein CM1200mP41_39070 [Gammaproteobacteria bacterium]|nr:MAG: hypothetical protein CM1200mP41_39070 [Gammaproteobacteria bacterium]